MYGTVYPSRAVHLQFVHVLNCGIFPRLPSELFIFDFSLLDVSTVSEDLHSMIIVSRE